MENKGIVWFDLETTGINPLSDRIIEICMVKEIEGKDPEVYQTLVQPDCGATSHPEAEDKHGISAEMLKNAPTFKEVAKDITDFIGDCDLGGYNVLWFDISVTNIFFQLHFQSTTTHFNRVYVCASHGMIG